MCFRVIEKISNIESTAKGERMVSYKGKKESLITLMIAVLLMIVCVAIINDYKLRIYLIFLILSAWILYVYGGANLLSPITLSYLMYLFFIALGPIMYYTLNISLNVQIYYLIIVSLFMMLSGYCMSKLSKGKTKVSKVWKINNTNFNSVIFVCNCIIVVSMLLKAYYIISNRAILFSGSLNSGRIEASSSNGIVIYGGNLWAPASCIIIEAYLKGKKISKGNWLLILFVFILGLFSGFRTGAVSFILIIVLMVNKKKKIPTIHIIFLAICVLFFLFFYEIIREGGNIGYFLNNATIVNTLTENAYVGTINLGYVLNAFPNRHDYLYGYGYLINLLMLLPGPDLDFTLTLKEMLGLSFGGGGVTPTIIGEFYLNFDMIGVYIGMFLSGIILLKIERLYQNSDLFYYPSLLMVEFVIAVRSGFANIEVTLLIYTIVYLFVCWVSKKCYIRL